MERAKTAVIVLVIIIAAMIVFWYLQVNPLTAPDSQPNAGEYQAVEGSLAEGSRVDLASPDRALWSGGDVGIYKLGISNQYNSQKTFYANVYLEGLSGDFPGTALSSMKEETSTWFTYPRSATIDADGIDMLTITARIPQTAANGIYSFRAAVCESQDCTDLTSASIYSSISFSMRVG